MTGRLLSWGGSLMATKSFAELVIATRRLKEGPGRGGSILSFIDSSQQEFSGPGLSEKQAGPSVPSAPLMNKFFARLAK